MRSFLSFLWRQAPRLEDAEKHLQMNHWSSLNQAFIISGLITFNNLASPANTRKLFLMENIDKMYVKVYDRQIYKSAYNTDNPGFAQIIFSSCEHLSFSILIL